MRRSIDTSWIAGAVLALAIAGSSIAAVRAFRVERALADTRAREVLAARAAEGASRIVRALLDAQADDTAPRCKIHAGRFLEPAESGPAPALEFVEERDAAGTFYLRSSERAEREGDLERAIGLLRVASAADRDADLAAVAGARLPALLRRRGASADEIAQTARAVVATWPRAAVCTREGLLLRTLAGGDAALIDDLCHVLGGPDAAIARGLLAELGAEDDARVAAREADLQRMTSARHALERVPAANGAARVGDALLHVRRAGADVTVTAVPMPPLPDGVAFGRPTATPERIVETVSVPLAGDGWLSASAALGPISAAGRWRAAAWSVGLLLLLIGATCALWQTRRAWRREREAADARARLLERIGHDLRTPLALIRMYAETLESGRVHDPAQARAFAGIAARESARLCAVVDDVLDLARVATSGARARALDLVDLARQVAADQTALLSAQGRTLCFVAPQSEVLIEADPDAVRGAIGNLIENAWRHGAGCVTVRVACAAGRAELRVEDEGTGVDAADATRVFERFTRGARAQGKGAGLGLALVKEVCEAAGGGVRFERNGRAAFVMDLPLLESGMDAAPRAAAGER